MAALAAARAGVDLAEADAAGAAPRDSLLPLIRSPRGSPRGSMASISPRFSAVALTQSQTLLDPEGAQSVPDAAPVRGRRRWNAPNSKVASSPRARIRRTTGLGTVPRVMPNIDDVSDFLLEIGLSQHVPTFRTNKVDGRVLLKLSNDHLKRLGLHALSHRQVLMKEREEWFNQLKAAHGDTRMVPRRPTVAALQKRRVACDEQASALSAVISKEESKLSPNEEELARLQGEMDKINARRPQESDMALLVQPSASGALPPHPADAVEVTLPKSWTRRWNSFNNPGWSFLLERANADFQPEPDSAEDMPPLPRPAEEVVAVPGGFAFRESEAVSRGAQDAADRKARIQRGEHIEAERFQHALHITAMMHRNFRAAAYKLGGSSLKYVFGLHDGDGDGMIDGAEFLHAVRTHGKISCRIFSDEDVGTLFRFLDRNGDGLITADEFLSFLRCAAAPKLLRAVPSVCC